MSNVLRNIHMNSCVKWCTICTRMKKKKKKRGRMKKRIKTFDIFIFIFFFLILLLCVYVILPNMFIPNIPRKRHPPFEWESEKKQRMIFSQIALWNSRSNENFRREWDIVPKFRQHWTPFAGNINTSMPHTLHSTLYTYVSYFFLHDHRAFM